MPRPAPARGPLGVKPRSHVRARPQAPPLPSPAHLPPLSQGSRVVLPSEVPGKISSRSVKTKACCWRCFSRNRHFQSEVTSSLNGPEGPRSRSQREIDADVQSCWRQPETSFFPWERSGRPAGARGPDLCPRGITSALLEALLLTDGGGVPAARSPPPASLGAIRGGLFPPTLPTGHRPQVCCSRRLGTSPSMPGIFYLPER